MKAQCIENDSSWWRHLASNGTQDSELNQWFYNAIRINSGNFKATIPKLAEKFDYPFHICLYSATDLLTMQTPRFQPRQHHAMVVINSKYFVFVTN